MPTSGAVFPVVIRDLTLVRKLLSVQVRKDKANGLIRVTIPAVANGGAELVLQWPIDPEAWDQQGKPGKGKESV